MLGARCLPTLACPTNGCVTTLAEQCPGCEATIVGFAQSAPADVARRLTDLGFAPGASVRTLRVAPLGSPVIYRVQGTEIILRRRDAAAILVAT